MDARQSIAIIMGGGKGTRLYPLTKDRCKPAVPLVGKYRLIDIPISNCLNSEINRIFVLTQYNSESLNRHIKNTYRFDTFSKGFVDILAAEQTGDSDDWYQGTADAVRHNIKHFRFAKPKYVVILSGDQLYQMDFKQMLLRHIEKNADISIAVIPVDRESAKEFGILKMNKKGKIIEFREKPKEDDILDSMKISTSILNEHDVEIAEGKNYLASMGIYIFNYDILVESLDNKLEDFGKHIIPAAINNYDVYSYLYNSYWEDIGTIKAFYNSNIDLASDFKKFDFYNSAYQVYTHARYLPISKINDCKITKTLLAEGCLISHSEIENSIIGLRSYICSGCVIKSSLLMGNDHYEFAMSDHKKLRLPIIGIGKNTYIEKAIIDKNARIGENVIIKNKDNAEESDGDGFSIRDGIVIIHKDAVIPDGTVI
ncbi:glucose-1-phosphate adenylyltransferase [Candidatus Dependentiae bacterium]|nr:glucose-1-phosphate adenylyltransferase [Candidatus Dependentiae bacterium]